MTNYLDLSGKVALVTGASSGIGAATAELMAELGALVAVGYHGNETGATDVCGRIRSAGGAAEPFKADVRDIDAVRGLVARVEASLGPIDVLVNNAGALVNRAKIPGLTEDGRRHLRPEREERRVLHAKRSRRR